MGLGFRVQGSGFRVQGLWFGVARVGAYWLRIEEPIALTAD